MWARVQPVSNIESKLSLLNFPLQFLSIRVKVSKGKKGLNLNPEPNCETKKKLKCVFDWSSKLLVLLIFDLIKAQEDAGDAHHSCLFSHEIMLSVLQFTKRVRNSLFTFNIINLPSTHGASPVTIPTENFAKFVIPNVRLHLAKKNVIRSVILCNM